MAEKHPHELELLSFVEEELDDETRHSVAEHLVACRVCADEVRRLEAARVALRAAPPLELSEERRAEMIAALPERRDPWRRFRPAKRTFRIAVPVAAALAIACLFAFAATRLGGGGDEGDAGEPAAAEAAMDAGGAAEGADTDAERDTDTATDTQPRATALDGATLVVSVQGPPAEIVRLLEEAGFQARADSSHSVFVEAEPEQVREALAGRPAGDVAVYVR